MSLIERCFPALGTYVEIQLSSDNYNEEELIHYSILAQRQIQQVHALMSFHEPTSELSALNSLEAGDSIQASPQMVEVISFCLELYHRSGRVFDVCIAPNLVKHKFLPRLFKSRKRYGNSSNVTVYNDRIVVDKPILIDLGGVAKGYAVDQAIECLPDNISAIINAGGDLRMTDWRGESMLLRMPDKSFQSHEMRAPAVATSSKTYQESFSICDPMLGHIIKPNNKSVSVFSPRCMWADALTKVAFLYNAPQDVANHYDSTMLLIS